MSEAFYPIETAEEVIEMFCDCTLPASEWDHGMHLVVGLYMHANHGDNAYQEIKSHIKHYNQCRNNQGYHETMTRFWTWAIGHFRGDENGKIEWTQEALDGIIFDDDLTGVNLWNEYYSKELMMSKEARETFLEPDLKSFTD